MSPTTILRLARRRTARLAHQTGRGRVYPGYGTGGRAGRAIPVPSRTLPGPIFSIFKAKAPTYGQMKANYEVSMRFPRMGPRMTQN